MAIDETMRKKINNDALAFLRSYADKRNRNPVLAATAITDAKAFTEKGSARRQNDRPHRVFRRRLAAPAQRPRNHPLRRHESHARARESRSAPISNSRRVRNSSPASSRPTCFSSLLIVGVLGLYTEFTHPGMVAPGVVGGICLVLALYAMHILPVNFAGIFLILARAGDVYSRSEIYKSRRSRRRRHRLHAAGRALC